MRALFWAFSLVALATNAFADAHDHPWVEKEARSYLAACDYPVGSPEDRDCRPRQEAFVLIYQDAYSGRPFAQRAVAAAFMKGNLGLPINKIQGCAWNIVAVFGQPTKPSDDEKMEAIRFCQTAGYAGTQAAQTRAAAIMGAILAIRLNSPDPPI